MSQVRLSVILVVLFAHVYVQAEIWALLVAGSWGWGNYRHQADVCHAYHVLHSHGVPEERIIVMMYDDIAYHVENPVPGNIINWPNGTNLYPGVPKDYTAENVNPENFLKLLSGQQMTVGSGKFLNTTQDDNIFVYFVDHGLAGMLCFPYKRGVVTKKQLWDALYSLAHGRRFNKMLFYLETCLSGSMFQNMSSKINIYATTAANATETSHVIYHDKFRGVWLGDVYSVKWMEDSDGMKSLRNKTVAEQYELVKAETNTSHVQQYGDKRIGGMPLAAFQGWADAPEKPRMPKHPMTDAVSSRDVPIWTLKYKIKNEKNKSRRMELKQQLTEMQKKRSLVDSFFVTLISGVVKNADETAQLMQSRLELLNLECHHDLVTAFQQHCFDLSQNTYALKYGYLFVNLCELGYDVEYMKNIFDDICQSVGFSDVE